MRESVFFGVVLTIGAYLLGVLLKKKTKLSFCNPLLVAVIFVIIVLLIGKIDLAVYEKGADYVSFFLTPATICLAVPLYQQLELLKKEKVAILLGIFSGVIASVTSVLALCILFGLTHEEYVTLLPKSVTTAIGMGISEELGGYVPITVAVIVITGIVGHVFGEYILRIFRITHPIAKGIAFGSASHAIGTTKAMELGEIEGAMSSLSIAVSGLITVIVANFFAQLY